MSAILPVLTHQVPPPQLTVLLLEQVHPTRHNPRIDAEADLSALTASLSALAEPHFAEPPLVEEVGPDEYRIIAGERRIRAANAAGWTTVACLVYPPIDPVAAHTFRLVENLHRKALHPIDEAVALKLSWVVANLDALDLQAEVRATLATAPTLLAALQMLLPLLEVHERFVPTHPPVTWDVVLDQLGIALSKDDRKRLLRLLSLDPEVHAHVRDLNLSEASMRALGTLEPEQQRQLVAEIRRDPALIGRIRRIARVVRAGDYSLDEAVAEAQGRVLGVESTLHESAWHDGSEDTPDADPERGDPGVARRSDGPPSRMTNSPVVAPEEHITAAVLAVLGGAEQIQQGLQQLEPFIQQHGADALPSPWGTYVLEALRMLRETMDTTNLSGRDQTSNLVAQ